MKLVIILTFVSILSFYIIETEAFWFNNLFTQESSDTSRSESYKKKKEKGDEIMKSMIDKIKTARQELTQNSNDDNKPNNNKPNNNKPNSDKQNTDKPSDNDKEKNPTNPPGQPTTTA